MLPEREIMKPEEAADFLRLSVSTVYQRKDIPRHRLPGSRQIRFIRSELLAWIKRESIHQEDNSETSMTPTVCESPVRLDNLVPRVYHRVARYR